MARTSAPEPIRAETTRHGPLRLAPAAPRHDRPALPPVVRERTARRFNAVVNHDAVRPFVTMPGQGALDLSAFVADLRNVVLMTEDGRIGIAFHRHEPGVYEAHTVAHPDARGSACLAAVQSMIAFMFTATDAMALLTRCPANNRPAEALARAVGGVLDFTRDAAWPTENGPVAVRHYRIDYPQWVRTADLAPRLGQWFHERLEAENARLGIPDDLHDDDPAHDRHVGAAVAMILCGQPVKGVALYNRWARFAGYETAAIHSLDPLVIDIRSHVIRVYGDSFEVLGCPQVQ